MPDLVGQTLGKYQIVERLGRGGMADVYKGYQPGLDRYVAVKVMHTHLSEDPDFVTRFQREAKAVAKLRHPHIIQVFDFDVQGEYYYMVMEYIEGGQTLKEMLQTLNAQQQRLPTDVAIDIIAKLADALDYAHQQGMIHRDIKPSNILIPKISQPILSDFGIARLIGETGLTSSGAMIGTPAYMSPEQGRGERADERSDIYALGIVLYEILTGHPPYDADTPYGVILKHINDPLVPPRSLISGLPEPVERVVFKSLAKNPEDRYPTAGKMRDALHSTLVSLEEQTEIVQPTKPLAISADAQRSAETMTTPVTDEAATLAVPPPLSPAVHAIQRKRVKWWVWVGAAIVGLILVGGIVGIATGLFRGLTGFAGLGGGVPAAEANEAARLVSEGFLLYDHGDPDAAFPKFDEAATHDPNNAAARAGRALVYLARGEFASAKNDLDEAQARAPNDPLVNYALGLLHVNSEEYYDPEAAFAEFSTAVEGCGDNADLCSIALDERAQLQAWHMNDFGKAIEDMNRAIEVQPDENQVPDLVANRAYLWFASGDVEQAMADFEQAYEMSNEPYFQEHAVQIAVQIGDYERALGYYDELLDDHGEQAHLLVGIGYIFWRRGQYDEARSQVERVLTLSPIPAEAHYLAALVDLESGRYESAIELLKLVAEEQETWVYDFPFFNPDFGHEVHYDMARAEWALERVDATIEQATRSIELTGWWPEPYVLRARAYSSRGQIEEARQDYQTALDLVGDNEELRAAIEEGLRQLDQ